MKFFIEYKPHKNQGINEIVQILARCYIKSDLILARI